MDLKQEACSNTINSACLRSSTEDKFNTRCRQNKNSDFTIDTEDEESKGDYAVELYGVVDIEKRSVGFERVVLSVRGMTCSGCERNLLKAVQAIRSVRNAKTSLLLARLEFDLDVGIMPVEHAISELKRNTSFNFQRIDNDDYQVLDVTIDPTEDISALRRYTGIILVDRPEKRNRELLRISYNGSEIGARDLLENAFKAKVALAPIQQHPAIAAGKLQLRKEGFSSLFSAILTIPVLVFAWAPIPHRSSMIYEGTSLVLATIIQLKVAIQFYPSAARSLFRSRIIEMDLLVALSTTVAYVFSIIAFVYLAIGEPLSTGTFFETSTLLATLIILGRFINELARQKATESISVRTLQAPTALLLNKERTIIKEVDARLLQHGDILCVTPHSRVVTDGIVLRGTSEVDESMITGEPMPEPKTPGSVVIAGSINGRGTLDVLLTALPGKNTISTIAQMVDNADLSKPRLQSVADVVAGYFVPFIIVITLIVFSIWTVIGIYAQGRTPGASVVNALTYSIATLVISCPCAIGLAVPMVIIIASGVAAQHGVIFKTPQSIEIARKTTHVVFDKTGTLTEGKMSVVEVKFMSGAHDLTGSLLLGLISDTSHPVSAAVAKHLLSQGVTRTSLSNVQVIPGNGLEATYKETVIRAGNCRWLQVDEHSDVVALLSRGLSVFCVTIDQNLSAVFGLSDSLRTEAQNVVRTLLSRGISVSIVSGDDKLAVEQVASQLSIPGTNTRSRFSPADKQTYIKGLLLNPRNIVMFCGDGTNDAVALAQSSLGVHMNSKCAAEIAQSAADVVLVRPDLQGVLTIIDLAAAAYRRILFNFAWTAAYNIIAISLAAGAFVHARIPPDFAGLGELCSVLPVILIAFGLKFKSFKI